MACWALGAAVPDWPATGLAAGKTGVDAAGAGMTCVLALLVGSAEAKPLRR